MATFTVTRTGAASGTAAPQTSRSDFIRGSGAADRLARPLTTAEQAILAQLVGLGVDEGEALDAIFLGALRRPLTPSEVANFPFLFDPDVAAAFGFEVATTLSDALELFVTLLGSAPFDAGPPPDNSLMAGDDRIYGRGGNDYVADLLGNNLVVTGDGDDRILLGDGADRVLDTGGDNVVTITGGRNNVTTGDGDDSVTTGAGDDNINVGDGRNIVDAGDGRNIVRGGEGFDNITVGTGSDFIELQTGGRDETEPFDLPFIGVSGFAAHNFVFDAGGADAIRATGSSRNDLPGRPDLNFNGNDLVLSDFGGVLGDDRIELGGGDNLIVDLGGNDTVRTLEGADIVFTSFSAPGNDDIATGAGDDVINPGGGADRVRGGAGADFVDLERDGFVDTILYLPGDQTLDPAATDIVSGFDTSGVDRIEMQGFGLGIGNLLIFNALSFGVAVGGPGADTMIAWDVNDDNVLNAGDFFTTILADLTGPLAVGNFLFTGGPA